MYCVPHIPPLAGLQVASRLSLSLAGQAEPLVPVKTRAKELLGKVLEAEPWHT